jgi:hypothetical protein
MTFLLQFGDLFFLVFHAVFTLFNALGWTWKKTRRLNLCTLLLTAASWLGLGFFFGIGYCPLTDWHYRILHKLGHDRLPYSYIQYAVERLTGLQPPPELTQIVTVAVLSIALICSCFFNYRDWKLKQRDLG